MALFKPIIDISGDGPGNGLELFVSSDIYRYDVDNRPLRNLADNDDQIAQAVDALVDEIWAAYTGKDWPTGEEKLYTALDPRLDNMDFFLRQFFEIRNVQYSSFVQFANFLRERYTSGFMNGPFPDKFIRSNYALENSENMPSPVGGYYVPERALTVHDPNLPDVDVTNMIAMETRIEQDPNVFGISAKRKPLYVHVNGYVIPLYNCSGGTRDEAETQDGHNMAGQTGPVTIVFPPAPDVGHRFDLAFLEVWAKEVEAGTDWFYPYGSVENQTWGNVNLFECAGSATAYSGQFEDRRDGVTFEESGWAFYVTVRDTPDTPGDRVDWWTVVPDAKDVGSGAISDNGSPYGINGTYNPDTMEWDLTFASPPPDGKWVVVGMVTKGFENPDRDDVRGSISFLPNGNYLQIQHRIRVVPGVDYEQYPKWFDDPLVEGRGSKGAKVPGYTFRNGLNEFHDGSLWYAGSGSSASKVDLGTFDGYTYGVPLCAWSRYNKAAWSYLNQNGGTGRPDGGRHNLVDQLQFLDLRPVVLAERYDMQSAASNTLDRILRGDHHSIFGQALTNYEDTGDPNDWDGQGVWGTEVPELWRVNPMTAGVVEAPFNYARDIGLSTTDDYSTPGYAAPIAHHDGIRRIFSPQEEVQEVPFRITDVDNSTVATPAMVVSYNNLTKTITLSTTDTQLSGYAVGSAGVIVNDTYPRLFWRDSRHPVKLATLWVGLGTNTATAVIDDTYDTYEANGTIDGFFDLLYPECTGIARPLSKADYVEFNDGVDNYNTIEKGNEDGSADTPDIVKWKLELTTPLEPGFNLPTGMCHSPDNIHVYVCDSANSRVVKLLASDLSHVAQWPLLTNYPVGFPAVPATQLTNPTAVATDAAGNVYVVDSADHRMVKLDANLTTQLATFGDVTTPGNDPNSTTTLLSPEGVIVDSNGFVYIADTGLFRLVKLNSGLTYVDHIGDGIGGAGQGQFIEPTGLGVGTVGGDEFIYVADRNRLVQVDAANMTVENILGSSNTESVQAYFRHVTADFFGFHEDANGNRYATSDERKLVMRWDSAWNLTHVFGQDGNAGWDDKHVQFPRDLIFDPYANLLYVADNSHNKGDLSRILIFNAANLELLYEFHPPNAQFEEGVTGLAFYADGGGANAKLYLGGGDEVARYTLGPVVGRDDPSNWSFDWVIDETTFGGANKWIHVHDIDVTADNAYLLVSDVWIGRMSKVDISGGSPGSIDHVQVGDYTNWPPSDHGGAGDIGCPLGIQITPDQLGVYVHGSSSPVGAIAPQHTIRLIDIATWTIVDEYYDSKNWMGTGTLTGGTQVDFPVVSRWTRDGNMYLMMPDNVLIYQMHAGTGDYDGFIPASGAYPAGASDISGDYLGNLAEIPLSYELSQDLPWTNVKSVHFKDDILYVTDVRTNTITAVEASSLLTLGSIGNPATIGRGKASMAGPSGVCVIGNNIFFTDTNNNRLMKGYKSYPNIERGTGRLDYLIPPVSTATVTIQARYTPYQGVWNKVQGEGAVYGRHFVTDNNTLYVSTLGRGSLTNLGETGGAGIYANMIGRLPTVPDTPAKAPRVTDEYLFAPEGMPITPGSYSPFLQLPVLNRYPATAQEVYPMYGGGSRFDFNRFFFLQGPGPGWPVGVPESFMTRGYFVNGKFPGFDTLETFPIQALAIPRMLFSTMVVELEGEGYLLIFNSYRSARGNVLNSGSAVSADVFKLYGNPGIKTRY